MLKFEWNPAKASENLRKHQVSFQEASTVFYDENAIQFYDEEHTSIEDRFLMLGMSARARLLIVVHCECQRGQAIRIISAREATRRERAFYRGG